MVIMYNLYSRWGESGYVRLYNLRAIVAVVVLHQLDIQTCTAKNFLLQRFDDTVITFIRQEKYCSCLILDGFWTFGLGEFLFSCLITFIRQEKYCSCLMKVITVSSNRCNKRFWTILSSGCLNIEMVNKVGTKSVQTEANSKWSYRWSMVTIVHITILWTNLRHTFNSLKNCHCTRPHNTLSTTPGPALEEALWCMYTAHNVLLPSCSKSFTNS